MAATSPSPFRIATPRSGRDPQGRHNDTDDDDRRLQRFAESTKCLYMVYGHERASTGTLHLQGIFQVPGRCRFRQIKRWLDTERIHLDISRKKPSTNRDYCLKEDPDEYFEYGDIQEGQGNRTDLIKIMDDMISQTPERTLQQEYGAEYLRLKKTLAGSIADAKMDEARQYMRTKLTSRLRPRQKETWHVLSITGDREVLFITDEYGNTGKTWFAQWVVQQHRAFYCNYTGFHDVTYGYKGQSLVVFDIPREGVEDLHYATIEALKNFS